MRILVHGINYHPETVGIGQYTTEMCEDLARRGHDLTVVTAVPYYPWWRIQDGYRGRLATTEEIRGVRVLRNWHYVPRRVTTTGRVLHELSFTALSMLRMAGSGDFDLLVTVSPPLFLGAVARVWGAVYGVPYVFVVKDLQPDAAADLGMLGSNPLMKLALRALFVLERWSYDGSALTTMLTEGMRCKVLAKGVDPDKVVVLPDWIDGERLKPEDPSPFCEEHGLEGKFVVLHAGNMGVKQGLENVLDAAAKLRDQEDVVFLLVGEGARKEALMRDAADRNLGNVRFLPLQPRERVAEMHSAADLCLLSQRPEVSDIVMPCKVLGIMACGRPIAAAALPGTEVSRTVESADSGLLVTPGDPDSLVRAIRSAKADPDACRRMGDNARRYALEHWEKCVVLDAFERQLLAVAGR